MDELEGQLIGQNIDGDTAAAGAFTIVMLDESCYLLQGCTGSVTKVPALVTDDTARPSTLEEKHPVLNAYLYDQVYYNCR